jgi:fluoroquinolone transport system ATP-binding protein
MIRVEGLTFRYPTADSNALAGLDFEVASGEIFGFLGPNGAGKSTTQKILIGLLRGFAGSVSLLGRPLEAWGPDLYEHIGVAFELPNHYLKLSGRENLEYFRALYSDGTVSPDALLERVGLAADAATPVGRYSKGMKTRLGIARALLNDPDLLFLDEPTTGLDPVGAQQIKQLLGELRQRGKTLFLTTHDMAVADQLCDRVAFLVDGTIRVLDAPRTLRLRHGSRRVRVESGASDGEGSEAVEFPLEGLGENREFLELLRGRDVQTIHTLEASLEHVFIELTGRRLQ